MTSPLRHTFNQELDTVDGYSHELLEICYAHGCVWLSTQSANSKEELESAIRYEFDFPSAEMAYLTAKRIVELLQKEIPGIEEASDAIDERKYS